MTDLEDIPKKMENKIKKLLSKFNDDDKNNNETYKCECIKCGHKLTSQKHCSDIKCPECGGRMRRVERPGPGKAEHQESTPDGVLITLENGAIQETADLQEKRALFDKEGVIPKKVNVKLAFAHIGTNLNLFTFIEEELIKAMPTVSGITGSGIPIQWGHETRDPRSTVGWTYDHKYENGTAYAFAEITNPEAIEMLMRNELRFCSMGCYLIPICSICGRDIASDPKCKHIRGREYKKDGKAVLCTIIGKDIKFDHIGFTNFPADPLATVTKQLAIASKQLDEAMELKVNNTINKEDVDMSDENEQTDVSELIEKIGELAAKIDELSISEEEIVSTAEKMSDIKLENEKLKEENEELKEKAKKAEKELEDLQKVNHEKIVNAVLEAEKKIKRDLDVEARKEELSEKSDEVLAALSEGLSYVKIEKKKDTQKTVSNIDTPDKDSKDNKSFLEMTPAERREKFSFEEICEKLKNIGE